MLAFTVLSLKKMAIYLQYFFRAQNVVTIQNCLFLVKKASVFYVRAGVGEVDVV